MTTEAMVAEDLKLEVSRVIGAPRSRVYDAWTRPEILMKWFGASNMTTAKASTDVRVGGEYSITMESCEDRKEGEHVNRVSTAVGVYKEIVPNEKLVFSWRGSWVTDEETLVTVLFRDVFGGTEVTLIHENFLTAESRDGHEKGWTGLMVKLQTLLDA